MTLRPYEPPVIDPTGPHIVYYEAFHGEHRWRVRWRDMVLIESTKIPEAETARQLHALGMRGKFLVYSHEGNGVLRMTVDIDKMARLMVASSGARPHFVRAYVDDGEVEPATDLAAPCESHKAA